MAGINTMDNALTVILVVSIVLCVVLTTHTVVRKLRRDRHEALFLARRARFRQLLVEGSVDDLGGALRSARRDLQVQFDLLAALEAMWQQLDEARARTLASAIASARLDRSLIRQLRARAPVRRGSATVLAARLRLPGAADLVALRLRDTDGDVRLSALHALGILATDAAAEYLVSALSVRHLEPERVIERLAVRWAVPVMLSVLDGDAAGVATSGPANVAVPARPIRASLARALGLAGDARAEPALCALLRRGGDEERIGAARALGTAGTDAAVPYLEAALEDASWEVRAQAARSLGLLHSTGSVDALTRHLSDRAWWVRASVADALVQLGDRGLVVLRDALEDGDPYVRDRAREALMLHHLEAGTG